MRVGPFLSLVLIGTASAQPRPFFDVATDRSEYESGEPIEVMVSITNPTSAPVTYVFPSGCFVVFELDGEEVPYGPCTLAEVPIEIGAGLRWEGIAEIYPDSTGYPVSGGSHELVGRLFIDSFGPASTTFTAPPADAGVVALGYDSGRDPSDFDALRDSLNADVLRASNSLSARHEFWQVSGAPLDSIVAEYARDSRFLWFEVDYEYRAINVGGMRFVTSSEETPDGVRSLHVLGSPCQRTCRVGLEMAEASASRVAVFDALGREVAVLHDGPLVSGARKWTLPPWLRSGLYVVRAETPRGTESVRVVVAQ